VFFIPPSCVKEHCFVPDDLQKRNRSVCIMFVKEIVVKVFYTKSSRPNEPVVLILNIIYTFVIIEQVRVQFITVVVNFSLRFFKLIFPATGCFSICILYIIINIYKFIYILLLHLYQYDFKLFFNVDS